MSRLNWEKASRRERLTYVPSPRSQPATQKQLDFIVDLHHQKGQRPPRRLPLTKQGASDLIERLKGLPDVNKYSRVRVLAVPEPNDQQESLAEFQAKLDLTPMTVNALSQIFNQIDPLGAAFFFDSLCREELPEDQDKRLIYILKEFVDQFAA